MYVVYGALSLSSINICFIRLGCRRRDFRIDIRSSCRIFDACGMHLDWTTSPHSVLRKTRFYCHWPHEVRLLRDPKKLNVALPDHALWKADRRSGGWEVAHYDGPIVLIPYIANKWRLLEDRWNVLDLPITTRFTLIIRFIRPTPVSASIPIPC